MLARFREDAARWVVPEGFADPLSLGLLDVVRLLRRHRQFRAMAWFRLGEWGHGASRVRGLAWFCEQRLQASYGLDLSTGVPVGGGFYLAHPTGCAINATSLGRNVSVVGAVTVGMRGTGHGPVVEDGAFIGAGARVIGEIVIGAGARVGANAVVLHDVDPDTTVVGIPARTIG